MIARILVVTGEEAQRAGPDRLRMGEVAERSGVSRASLYRYFANKEELIQAYTMSQLDELFAGVDDAMRDRETFEDKLAAGFGYALPWLRSHPVFKAVLALTERQPLRSTLESGEALAHARELTQQRINAGVRDGLIRIEQFDAAITSELIARVAISLVVTPETAARLETSEDAAEFARRFLVPMVEGLAAEPLALR